MKIKHNILLGLPPHDFNLHHPLHTKFGIFFHIKKGGKYDNTFESIFDWLKSEDISNLSSTKEFLKFLNSLKLENEHEINLAIFTKREFISKKEICDILLIIKEFNNKKNITINLKTDINKFETFYSKLDFYSFCKDLDFEDLVPKFEKFSYKTLDLIKFPFLIRNATSSGGKDTYLIKNKITFYFMYFHMLLKTKLKILDKSNLFIQEFIDTKIKFGYYRSYRVLAFNKKPYFIYPNISKTNPITHVSEKDKLSKEEFLESVRFGIDLFNQNKEKQKKIFDELGNPFSALDLVSLDSKKIFVTEAELKYGPSEKYIDNQIKYFELDKSFFNYIRDELKTNHLSFNDIKNIFE